VALSFLSLAFVRLLQLVRLSSRSDTDLALEVAYPGRFLLGLGASHAPVVEQLGTEYALPYTRMVHYLDELDVHGPRMLTPAAEQAAGPHPYFVPVEHVARARALIGPGPLLAPELAVVLEVDPADSRATAREYPAGYLRLPN
jgi:alkanesulfonate monooxygenase SsuD/methylene tetrahydromethanopterin reductase-like flavin-dependent oxidoreductase (luciferase family)